MRSPALPEFADWFHQTRDMLLWAGLGMAGLIVGLWWVGTDRSSPIPAAEQAVREAMRDVEAPLGKSRMHHWTGYRQWLVCGTIEGETPRPFAALVHEKKHSSPLSMIDNGDNVRVLAIPGITAPHARRTEMLEACAAHG